MSTERTRSFPARLPSLSFSSSHCAREAPTTSAGKGRSHEAVPRCSGDSSSPCVAVKRALPLRRDDTELRVWAPTVRLKEWIARSHSTTRDERYLPLTDRAVYSAGELARDSTRNKDDSSTQCNQDDAYVRQLHASAMSIAPRSLPMPVTDATARMRPSQFEHSFHGDPLCCAQRTLAHGCGSAARDRVGVHNSMRECVCAASSRHRNHEPSPRE
eukprot:3722871-Rhodomonas_salina.2